MNNKLFVSLSTKIILIFFICLSAVTALLLSVFLQTFVNQAEQESSLRHKKAQSLLEMYEENILLRDVITADSRMQQDDLTPEQIKEVWSVQKQTLEQIKPLNKLYLTMRRELLRDVNNAKRRDMQMELVTYAALMGTFITFVFLVLMWLVIRCWILVPTEKMLEFTQKVSAGDFNARVPVASKESKSDEMDLLARDLNKMADSIQDSLKKTQEGQMFLQNLIDALPEGLRVVDEDFNIVMSNKTYQEMFKHLACPQAAKCFEQVGLQAPCPQEINTCPLRMLKQSPEKPIKLIHKYKSSDGREFYLEVSAGLLHYQNKQLMLEMSRSLDKEIQFSHQQKLSALGLLASSVAHEMRNPLGSVRLIMENVLDKMSSKPLPPEEMKRYMNLILEQVRFCINVTTRLLKLSRKPDKEIQTVDLNEIIPETTSLLEYEAKKRGIELVLELSEKPAEIKASDAEMRMVLVNLTQNAFHAMSAGGTLLLKTEVREKSVVLQVKDGGCGIPSENLQRIFEPFFSDNQENKESGTGLGLPIVKSIVENFSGKIEVESTPGQGTTFSLTFSR